MVGNHLNLTLLQAVRICLTRHMCTHLTYEVEAGIDTLIHGDCVVVDLPGKSQQTTLNKLP